VGPSKETCARVEGELRNGGFGCSDLGQDLGPMEIPLALESMKLFAEVLTRLTKLAFVAPSIVEAVVEGRSPIGVNLQMLMDGRLELAPCWSEQQRMFRDINRKKLIDPFIMY
jgi:hypothetical protein